MESPLSPHIWTSITPLLSLHRDGQNHHMLMILKSKSNHLDKNVI